jgi:predicted solute-binding protein
VQDLRLGCVKYLNARPLIDGWAGEVVYEHPAALCDMLAEAKVAVALVSSFEYLRDPIYKIIDGASISSAGAVYSVFVAHEGNIADLSVIELDPASRTSANLLQCVLADSHLTPALIPGQSDPLAEPVAGRGKVLIGDQAIRFRQRFGDRYHYFDLGLEWHRITEVPFVYALWLIRPEVDNAKLIADALRDRLRANLLRIDQLAASQKGFDAEFCKFYFTRCLRFDFAEREKQGLHAFHQRCADREILPATSLHFDLV